MVRTVLQSTTYALNFIHWNNRGTIYAIYPHSIVIQMNDTLIVLKPVTTTMLYPINLITDMTTEEFAGLGLSKGMEVKITPEYIEIPLSRETLFLDLTSCVVKDLLLTQSLPEDQLAILEKNIREAVLTSDSDGFNLLFKANADNTVVLSLFLIAAGARIKTAKRHMEKGRIIDFTDEINALIGLGSRETPSADDFIYGILAGLILQGQTNHPLSSRLWHHIAAQLDHTNKINAAFLRGALVGQFSEPIQKLYTVPDAKTIQKLFHTKNSTAGMDSLTGVYYSLILFK